MTALREAAQAVLDACTDAVAGWESLAPLAVRSAALESLAALRAALAQQAEPVEPVATVTECEACFTPDVCQLRGTCDYYTASQMRIAAPQQQAEPLTVERLRDALVASRIIPPAAVEDPDGYDDGVTLFRIEALHRRLK